MLPDGYEAGKPCNTPPTTIDYGMPREMPATSVIGKIIFYDSVPFYTSDGYNRVRYARCNADGWSVSGGFNADTRKKFFP